MKPITIEVSARTDVGNEREHNEDNFLVADLTARTRTIADGATPLGKRGIALAVCDGMGGAAAGEVASELAVSCIFQHLSSAQEVASSRDTLAKRLEEAAQRASEKIHDDATANVSRSGMGTTLTGVALVDDHLIFVQVGDSRGYLLRKGKLTQVTRDQSLVAKLVERGALTEEQALTFEHSNIILQALGASPSVVVDLTQVELRRGDRLLLCSDGLSGMVTDEEIRTILEEDRDPTSVSIQLVERAKELGGHDNVTAIVAYFGGQGLRTDNDPVEVHRYGGGTELLAIPNPRRLGELLQLPTESPGTAVLTAVVSDPPPPPSLPPAPPAPSPPPLAPAPASGRPAVAATAASGAGEAAKPASRESEKALVDSMAAALAVLPASLPAIPPQPPLPEFPPPSGGAEAPIASAVDVAVRPSAVPSMAPATSGSRNTLVVAAALLAVAIVGGSVVFLLADSRAATTTTTAKPPAPAETRSSEPGSTWTALDTSPAGSYASPGAQPSSGVATPAPGVRTEPRANAGARTEAPRAPAASGAKPPATAASIKRGDLAPQRDDE